MRILGIDPGNTTGFALIEWDGHAAPELLDHAEVPFDEMPVWVLGCFSYDNIGLAVYERFHISPRTISHTRQPEALYVIGGVIFLAALHHIPLRAQNAADAKTAYPDERIKPYGIKTRHAKDALRHALLATHSRGVYSLCTDTDTDKGDPDARSIRLD